VHVDIAVTAVAAPAGERIADQCAPDLAPGEAVDNETVRVLEDRHGAAGDLVRLPGAQRAQLVRCADSAKRTV
jgi:hypothetical protein